MKRFFWLIGFVAAASALAQTDAPFSRQMSPEEFRAAGLAKLTPEELAKLDALFGKYSRPGAETAAAQPPIAVPTAPVTQPVSPTPPSEPVPSTAAQDRQREIEAAAAARVAAAEARAKKAEEDAAVARAAAESAKAEQKKTEGEGFFTRAKKVLVSPGTKVEVQAVETEIDGAFNGWDEGTVWRMTDGTIWRVDNKPTPLQAKRVLNPKVRIYPATMSGFWLEFVDLDYKLRVRQLK